MKKIFNIFLIALLLTFTACNSNLDEYKNDEIADLSFALVMTERTAMPQFDVTNLGDIELSYNTAEDETKTILGSGLSYSTFIAKDFRIPAGTYNFYISATIGSYSFSGSSTNVAVSGEKKITFALSQSGYDKTKASGSGSVDIKYNLDSSFTSSYIKKIKVNLYSFKTSTTATGNFYSDFEKSDISYASALTTSGYNGIYFDFTSSSGKYVKFNRSDIAVGSYIVELIVYGDNGAYSNTSNENDLFEYARFMEAVNVEAGTTSSLDSETKSMYSLYTITYDCGNSSAAFVSGYQKPVRSTAVSSLLLPTDENIVCTGKFFQGWYTNAEYSGDPVTELGPNGLALNEDITLYAKWIDGIAYTVKHEFETTTGGSYTSNTSYPNQTKYALEGQNTNAAAKEVTGFIAQEITQVPVASDGSTIVTVKYDRKKIKYSFDLGNGSYSGTLTNFITSGSATCTKEGALYVVEGLYGASCQVANPYYSGYTFTKWTGTDTSDYITASYSFVFGSEDKTYTAYYGVSNPYSSYTQIYVGSSYSKKSIINSSGVDYYYFKTTSGKTYTITWGDSYKTISDSSVTSSDQTVDIKVALLEKCLEGTSNKISIATSYQDSPSLTFSSDGTYYVKIGVQPYTSGKIGKYVIRVTSN